jgi:hypothetical protein
MRIVRNKISDFAAGCEIQKFAVEIARLCTIQYRVFWRALQHQEPPNQMRIVRNKISGFANPKVCCGDRRAMHNPKSGFWEDSAT